MVFVEFITKLMTKIHHLLFIFLEFWPEIVYFFWPELRKLATLSSQHLGHLLAPVLWYLSFLHLYHFFSPALLGYDYK